MLKSIKKSFKYLAIFAGIVLLVPAFIFSVMRLPDVQTFLVRRITSHLSDEIKSTIKVGRIEYSFFNRLTINDLVIKDKYNDTLIYLPKISSGVRKLDFRNKAIRLGRVEITEPVVAFITDSSGIMNLRWYLDMLKKPPETKPSKAGSLFSANSVAVTDGRFSLIRRNAPKGKMTVNFNNLRLSGINGNIKDFRIKNDSTSFSIDELGFIEGEGLILKKMRSDVAVTGNRLIFSDVLMDFGKSVLNAGIISIDPDTTDSFKRFAEEVKLRIHLEKSLVSSSELQYFIPFLKDADESLWLSGKISGTISELRGRNIELTYRDSSHIYCDFDFSGLPEIDDTFMFLDITSLGTNAADLEKINLPGKDEIKLPEILYTMGSISFNGSFAGFTTDFVTYGKLSSTAGILSTDVSLRPVGENSFRIEGFIKGQNIDMGEVTGKNDMFGKLSMKTNVDINASSAKNFSGRINGSIDSIEINRYVYRNIAMAGDFSEKAWDGSIKIVDNNIRADILGLFDFSGILPEFDFTLNLNKADLYRLNFDKADSSSQVSLIMTANFKGNNIDNLSGEIKLLNSTLRKFDNTLDLYDFTLKAFTENNKPAISMRTDFVDVDIRGYYSFREIGTLTRSAMASLMPSRFIMPENLRGKLDNNFDFSIRFRNTDQLNHFFRTGVLIAEKSIVEGAVYPDSIISINAKAGHLEIKKTLLRNMNFNLTVLENTMDADLRSSSLILPGNAELKDFYTDLHTVPDNFIFSAKWDNKEKILNRGNVTARGSFIKDDPEHDKAILNVSVEPSEIYTRSNLWTISGSDIIADSNSVSINRFLVSSGENFYRINGKVSEDPTDTLYIDFRGIDLSPLNYMGDRNKKNRRSLGLNGILNGNIHLNDAYNNPMIESEIIIKDFSILGAEYGDLSAESVWNSMIKVADLRAETVLNGKKLAEIKGFYDPLTKKIDVNAHAADLPVDFLNPLLDFFASDIHGTATGNINISGELSKLSLTGDLMAENTSLKIDYLNTKYRFSDIVRFDRNGIAFNNIRLTDEKGNNAVLSGKINHTHLKNYRVDLLINMNDCLVLNTRQGDNDLFYGTVFARGVTTIKSAPGVLSFDISARTRRNTAFFIPLNSGTSMTENSFVSFVSKDSLTLTTLDKKSEILLPAPSRSGLELNIDLNVTPDAEVQLLIDPKAGDVIRGRGSGNLNVNLSKAGVFKISGDYTIEDGDYLFTLGNILNKSFIVENGGKINFPGDIENAEIDIKAIYKLRTSLYEILQDNRFNERIPVECQLNLSGRLFSPIVGFNIHLPNADEETRTYLKNAITTEEELSRQFLYLLVMNSFYSDPSYRSSLSTSSTGTSAMAVTTTEMLSNQLSNWLSQISNDFDIGFIYRPGYKDVNSQEVQVALSTQILNDKVTINGNFDVRGADNSYGNPITGDFDIEYKLAEKIRLKVFNRFNNPYTGKGVPYTQGIGIFFKQDFNSLSDLLRRRSDKSEMKKEEDVVIEQ